MVKTPVIIGIDPGTTSAYAILDVNGELIEVNSSKEMGLSELIRNVIKKGLPIVVGTDKAKSPDLIEKFAAKTGCRIIVPECDLKADEKKEITVSTNFKDTHQMDATASAKYAYKKLSNTIRKIQRFVADNSKESILDELIVYVIRDELNIGHALQLIDGKDEETKIVKKAILERNFGKKDFLKIYNKLKIMERDNSLMKKYNAELRNKINKMEREILKGGKKKGIDTKKIDILFSHKEKRLNEMNKKLEDREKYVGELREELEEANSFISKLNDVYLLKRLKNLGIKEFEDKKKLLNISKGDLLLVDDPNVYNEKTIRAIKDKVNVIVYKKSPIKKTGDELRFNLISIGDIRAEEFGNFAFSSKEDIDKKLEKNDILRKVIEEYKESRRT